MPFLLAIDVSSNPINFINAHSLHQNPISTMHIDEVKWITGNFGSRHCVTKCALENKPLNQKFLSWFHFSREKLPHILTPVITST